LLAGLDAVVEPALVELVPLVGLGAAVPLDVAPAADGVLWAGWATATAADMATAVNKVEPASSRLLRFTWIPSTDDELGH
jgi:hypothetical protein